MLDHPTGAGSEGDFRLDFDPRVRLEFHGSKISSDGGLLLFRELDETLGLHDLAGRVLQDTRTGKNGVHDFVGLLRQSTFGRLAGYPDVNDADRLSRDPVMRQIVGGQAVDGQAASTSQMARFETDILTSAHNRAALADLPGQWVDAVHDAQPPKWITLDMDSSVSPTHGDQEGTAWNGHFDCKCYHPLFVFNQFSDLERCALRNGNLVLNTGQVFQNCPQLTQAPHDRIIAGSIGWRRGFVRRHLSSFSVSRLMLDGHP